MKLLKPVYTDLQSADADDWEAFCSWCGMAVRTAEQQTIHTQWHRAVGVVPMHVDSDEDPYGPGPGLQAPITVEDLQPPE